MKIIEQLRGTGVALVTPFDKKGKLDLKALKKLVNHQVKNGVNYLVVLGTTGEPATLTIEEKDQVKETIIKENNGRLPLVLGIGGNNTKAVIDEIKNTDLTHFSAILSVSPYYNRPTQEGIYAHFEAVSLVSPLPIIIYNVPSRTGSNITAEITLKLAKNCSNIIGVKEAAGDMVQAMRLLQDKPNGFLVISGDDMLALSIVLAGGDGVISVIGQGLPKAFSNMIELGLKGHSGKAFAEHYKMIDGIDLIFEEGNPAGIKSLLSMLDICQNQVRLPLLQASALLQEKLSIFVNNNCS